MHTKKHLSFTAIRKALSEFFGQIADRRQQGKVSYCLHDCLMSAVAMMFFQDPSVLSFQRRMQDNMHSNNLKSLFAVESIPNDTCLRETLDAVATEQLIAAFCILFQRLQRGKQLEPFRLDIGSYLIALDGTQYFSSEKIHCPSCLTHKGAKGPLCFTPRCARCCR